MPNVKIGKNVIIGAGALASKDLESNGVYVGIPARKISSFNEYMARYRASGGKENYPYVAFTRKSQQKKFRMHGFF